MGLGGVSLWKLIIVLLIFVLIFGTKRLKALASAVSAERRRASARRLADVPAPRQAKLDNAEPDAEFPEQTTRRPRVSAERLHVRIRLR